MAPLQSYPGRGIGQTWLGADGATITLERGILKASRGMGDDLMGANSAMLPWKQLENDQKNYKRQLQYLSGNNKIVTLNLTCKITKDSKRSTFKIWEVEFKATKFEENCKHNIGTIRNIYYLDDEMIVRKSFQYHSETLGFRDRANRPINFYLL